MWHSPDTAGGDELPTMTVMPSATGRPAAKVLRDGDESLVQAVESGKVAVSTAAVVAE